MADYRDHVGGQYLKAEDYKGRAPIRVTVESVELEAIKSDSGAEENKLVARFVGIEKGLVMNKTNLETLAFITNTNDYERWGGAKAELYHDPTVKMGSKTVGGIRLRVLGKRLTPAPVVNEEPQPQPAEPDTAPAAPATDGDDIPF